MVNEEIRQFRDSIIIMTNACPLPIEIKRLVFAEIQTQISAEAEKVILLEKQEQNNNIQEEKNND